MKIWKMKKDNRGLSLVEVICAVAIFAVIGTAVGGIMVVTANSYTNGTNEVNLQQEAQLAANQIADLLIDTTADVQFDGTTLTVRRMEKTYTITYAESENRLYYAETSAAGSSDPQLLAENVTEFAVVVTDFATNGNARVRLKFEKDGRAYESWYTVAARNGMGEAEALEETAALVTMSEITLEPNEEFELKATVVGSVANKGVVWGAPQGALGVETQVYEDGGKTKIKIDKAEVAPKDKPITIPVSTAATKDGSPMATALVKVYVRRVNDVIANGWRASGAECKNGAVYKVSAPCTGDNLSRVLGVEYDSTTNYKNPYYCQFDCDFTVNGSPEPYGAYFDIVKSEEDVNAPSLQLKLKQDMPSNSKFTVTVKAKHSQGNIGGTDYNKSGAPYGAVTDSFEIVQAELPEGPHEIESGGLERGNNMRIGWNGEFESLKQTYNGVNCKNSWRYKIEGGDWSPWTEMNDKGTQFSLEGTELSSLRPDREYDIQIKTEIVDGDGKVVWPLSSTPEDDYLTNLHIGKVTIYFKGMPEIGLPDSCTGNTQATALQVKQSHGTYNFRFETVSGAVGNYIQDHLKIQWKKLDSETGVWNDLGNWGDQCSVSNTELMIGFKNNTSTGMYRAELTWKNEEYHYNDGTNDIGIFYFHVTE